MMKNNQTFNLLIFTLEFPPFIGGVATYNYELAIGIAGLGYKVNVLTCDYPSMHHEQNRTDRILLRNWGIEVIRREKTKRISLLQWVIIVRKFILNPDNRIDYTLITDIGAQKVSSFINFKKEDIKYFITVHGSEIFTTFVRKYSSKGITKTFFPVFKRYAELFYSKADGIIFVSEYTKHLFFEHFKHKVNRCRVIHNGIDRAMLINSDELKNSDEDENKCCNLITVSRIDARKNHENVIRAIASMPNDLKKRLTYDIVGEGPYEPYLRNLVEDMKLSDTVQFYGRVTTQEKLELLDKADIYIMPSQESKGTVEGLGLSFLEAGARGLPLIGGRHGGVPEVIRDGTNGFLVNPTSSDEIRDAILQLLRNEKLRQNMSINSLQIVRENFNRDKMASGTINFITEQS
jgi:glycosyltransferase involved in cell wall biosynthesis